jgi:carboxymethylenebutenolidase
MVSRWGVTNDAKAQAFALANEGFRVFIPDLYRGKLTLDAAEAKHEMEGLDFPGAVGDVKSCAVALKAEGSSGVGVAGTCMGGALAFAAGCNCPEDVACVNAFYGIPPPGLADLTKMKVPSISHFGECRIARWGWCRSSSLAGEHDNHSGFSDPAAVDALEEKLKASGSEYVIHRYKGVGHAFMNSLEEGIKRKAALGMGVHDPDAVTTAWSRMVEFFKKHTATA